MIKKNITAEEIRKRCANLKDVYRHHSIQLLPDLLVEGGKGVSDLELKKSI